ncbi:MAG TPA: DUF748 domain-containing protein, partial [Candidatus Binatia bacterium]|nr:DUF748 domain-containing protein [Candidatus Binatia bacterium]
MASKVQELRWRAERIARHPRTKKIAIWIASVLIAIGILGALIAPPLIRAKLAAELSEKLHRDVAIQQVRINPYAMSVTIRGFSMKEHEDSAIAVAFDELYLNVEMRSLIQWGVAIKELRLSKPYINLIRNGDRTYNFQDLIDEFTAGPPGGSTPRFSLRNIEVIDGKIDFDDRPEQTKHTLSSIRIGVPFLSSLPLYADVKVKPAFSALLNGSPIQIAGDTEPFKASHETTIQLNIDKLEIPTYLSYSPVELRFGVPTGQIDGKLTAAFRTYEDKPSVLSISGSLTLKELVLKHKDDKPLLSLPALQLAIEDFEVFANRGVFRTIKAHGLELNLTRDRSGRLNLASLVDRPKPTGRSEPKKEGTPFSYQVGEILLESSTLHFVDELPGRHEATLNNLRLNVKNLTNEPEKKADVELSFESEAKEQFKAKNPPGKASARAGDKKGTVRLMGTAGVNPTSGQFNLEAQDLELPPLQPYFAEQVNFVVTSGKAGTKGDLSVESGGDGPLKVDYAGSLQVADFAALDRDTTQDLFKWKSLEVPRFQLAMSPLQLRANEINVADFYARIFIGPDGKFNLQKLAAEEKKAPGTPSEPDLPTPSGERRITIGKINLKGGDVHFSDLFIKPNYSANLAAVQGTISELKPEAPGDLDIQAKLDNAAPVEVRGKINPLGKDLFMDLNGNATDIDLIDLSPYSGKYLGYGIAGGKLSFQVHYKLADRKLEGQNKIILNQLTFGDKVESPQATNLPVLLAVALLKDRNGVIDVNLPIGGSLDDPEFSVGGIVLRLILNIITKAVTAPFTLLGSIFGGGGEELSYIEFDHGRSDLTPAALSRLKSLATAMDNRPALKLEISGRFDPVNDLEGLKRVSVERKVKAQKMKQLTRQGTAPSSVDDVQINSDEYERFLKAAYGEEKFPKPRNVVGLAKDLPLPEMESLMAKYA